MHIEVFEGERNGSWFWRVRSGNYKIVTDAEEFYSQSNAKRAAKNFIRSVFKETFFVMPPEFMEKKMANGVIRIYWA